MSYRPAVAASWLLLLVLLLCRDFEGCNGILSPVYRPSRSTYQYRTEFFDTFVDHFNFLSDRKFRLKYLVNDREYKAGGPIFFYTGNEGKIEAFAENTGLMWDLAKEFHAMLIFAEHRYYGDSGPFGKESLKNRTTFAYLSAEQALADYALLLTSLKASNESLKSAPVISFGGSYGGMLTAWFRAKYPNLVAGGIAGSAPIFAFPGLTDYGAFARVETQAFATSGSQPCVEAIRKAWPTMQKVKPSKLSSIFHTCKPLADAGSLRDWLLEFMGDIAMVNYPYPASFLGEYPAWPVKEFCKPLNDYNKATFEPEKLMLALSRSVHALTNYTKTEKCLDLEAGPESLDADAWELQTCLELTIPMSTNGETDMFPPQAYDPKAFRTMCMAKYGVEPRQGWAKTVFWGRNLPKTYTNVVFSNGKLDPWSGLGVLSQKDAPGCSFIMIPSGAHHLDLRGSNPADPRDVYAARRYEAMQIYEFIRQWNN